MGNFNCHHEQWGYAETDANGSMVETWASLSDLSLVYNPKGQRTFQSCRWKKGYNPDLVFVSQSLSERVTRTVLNPIPHTQHRPVLVSAKPVVSPVVSKPVKRFNFGKADWASFSSELDSKLDTLDPTPANYDSLVALVKKVACQYIPRGCQKLYIRRIKKEDRDTLRRYHDAFQEDPFSEETVALGSQLLSSVTEARRKALAEMIENTDVTRNSKKAWSFIKKLSADPHGPVVRALHRTKWLVS